MLGYVLQLLLHNEVVSFFLCVLAKEAPILFHLRLRLCLNLSIFIRIELGTLLAVQERFSHVGLCNFMGKLAS